MVNTPSPTADFDRVQVRGEFVGWDGAVIGGSVTFTPRAARAVDAGVKTIIVARPITATIGNDGSFAVLLPATDDPDINVTFTYQVTENFAGGETYDITVPIAAAATGIDLALVARTFPVDSPTGEFFLTAGLQSADANAFFDGTVYPTRLSVTTDTTRRVRWIGPITNPPTIGGAYAISGFDIWEITP